MTARKYTDIQIQGMTFPTVEDAADHFGVTGVTIRSHIRAGTLHRLGKGLSGPEPCPVRIRGVTYESPAKAAEELGVGINQVYRRLAEGRPDTIGLPNDRGQHCAKPIKIGPLKFRSLAEASRELGFSEGYVGRAFERDSSSMKEKILAAAIARAA